MENPSLDILPWSTVPLWQAANQTIAHTIRHHNGALQHLFDYASRIRERIHALDAHMNHLCRRTCPQCQAVCCQHAHAYFDFKDLLYLHFSQSTLPERQTLERAHQTCRYLGAHGCLLPRQERPFICTWYLCPTQMAFLKTMASSVMIFLLNSIRALKSGREKLQSDYIIATAALESGEYNL